MDLVGDRDEGGGGCMSAAGLGIWGRGGGRGRIARRAGSSNDTSHFMNSTSSQGSKRAGFMVCRFKSLLDSHWSNCRRKQQGFTICFAVVCFTRLSTCTSACELPISILLPCLHSWGYLLTMVVLPPSTGMDDLGLLVNCKINRAIFVPSLPCSAPPARPGPEQR
jgi:hypothetical protein